MQSVLKRRQFSAGLMAAVVPFITPRYASAQLAEGASIVLGQSGALSGEWAEVTKLQVAGARLAFDQFNASPSGGLGRRTIELHSFDDGYSPQRSAANTRRLIDSEVFALFGYGGTATSIASMAIATEARMPFFSPFTGARELRQPFNKWVFHVRPAYAEEVEGMLRHLVNMGLSRFAVFCQEGAYGRTVINAVNASLATHGLEPATEGVQTATSREEVEAIMETLLAARPQAIIQANTPANCATLVRGARQKGYGGMFYHLSVVGAENLSKALRAVADGLVVSQVVPSPYKNTHPLTREFLEAIAKHGQGAVQPNYLSLEAYFSARVLIEGLRNAHMQSGGKLTREALVYGLESLKKRVLDIPIAYSSSNHVGSRFIEMSVLTKDGRVRV